MLDDPPAAPLPERPRPAAAGSAQPASSPRASVGASAGGRVRVRPAELTGLLGDTMPVRPAGAMAERRAAERARRERGGRLRALGVLVAVVTTGMTVRAFALYDTPTPRIDEATLVTQVTDLAHSGAGVVGGSSTRIGALAVPQLTAFLTLDGGWDRAPSALGAVREVSLVAWLAVALLTWLLARRLGVGRPWALAGLAALVLCPVSVEVARLALTENLAAAWGLAALVVAAGPARVGRRQLWADLTIAGLFTVGTLTSLLAAALLPAVLLVAARHGDPRRTLLLGLLCLPGPALALITAGTSGGGPDGSAGGWLGRDLVTPALVLLVGLGALCLRRWRALGVGMAAVALVALGLGLPPAAAAPLVLPLAAAALGGLGQSLPPLPGLAPGGPVPGWVAPAALVGLLCLGWAGNLSALPEATAPPPTEWARDWLASNVPTSERVMTDDVDRVVLATAGGWSWVVSPAGCARQARLSAAPTPAGGCADADWWVLPGSMLDGAGAPPAASGTLVARFGTEGSPGRIEVWSTRQPAPDPVREALGRQVAGRMLVASPQLQTTPELADRLRAGELDPRAATALGALLGEQQVRLVGLPEIAGEQAVGRPLRQLLVATGGPGDAAAHGDGRLADFFTAQMVPFRPYAMATTPEGVLVRYSPQGPPGLLDALVTQ